MGEELSLEMVVEEMLREELKAEMTMEKAFWTKRWNMITTKLKNNDQKRKIMDKRTNLKGKNIFIDNDLAWKDGQIQKEIRMIVEVEKRKGAKVKIGYRKL